MAQAFISHGKHYYTYFIIVVKEDKKLPITKLE